MMIIHRIPAFRDNYLWLFHQSGSDRAYVVDPGDAGPVLQVLDKLNLHLDGIIITHHHQDHTGGIDTLLQANGDIPVYGPDSPFIPQVNRPLSEGDNPSLANCNFQVLAVPGHTLDHIAYFAENKDSPENAPILFCGDTLFAGGCGRLFEGTPEQMYHSLQKLAHLPRQTKVYCAHEYTQANLNFALAVEPENADLVSRQKSVITQRNQHIPTVPSNLAEELSTNPFLRCHIDSVRQAAEGYTGQQLKQNDQVFAAIRQWKDQF